MKTNLGTQAQACGPSKCITKNINSTHTYNGKNTHTFVYEAMYTLSNILYITLISARKIMSTGMTCYSRKNYHQISPSCQRSYRTLDRNCIYTSIETHLHILWKTSTFKLTYVRKALCKHTRTPSDENTHTLPHTRTLAQGYT